MRSLFIVGVKLIGLLVLYWALQHIAPLLSWIRVFWTEVPANAPALDPVWDLVMLSASFLVAMAFAVFLLLRGEALASLVPLPELPNGAAVIAPSVALQTGIVIAGLLMACSAAPKLLLDIWVFVSSPSVDSGSVYTAYGQSRLAESGIELILAWFLVFRSTLVARLIAHRADDDGPPGLAGERAAPTDAGETARE